MCLESLGSQILKWRENALNKESLCLQGKEAPWPSALLPVFTDPSSRWRWLPQPPHLLP